MAWSMGVECPSGYYQPMNAVAINEEFLLALLADLEDRVTTFMRGLGPRRQQWSLFSNIEDQTGWNEPIGAAPVMRLGYDEELAFDEDWVDDLNAMLASETAFYGARDMSCSLMFYAEESAHPKVAVAVLDHFRFRWTRRIIKADFADIHGELFEYLGQNTNRLAEIDWRSFERLMASVFQNQGFRAVLGPGSHDGGVDIRLYQHDAVGEMLTLVQAKRQALHRPVDLDAVLALSHRVIDEHATRGVFVTSSRYLPQVHDWAASQSHRLVLADGRTVGQWCLDVAGRLPERHAAAFELAASVHHHEPPASAHLASLVGSVLVGSVGSSLSMNNFALVVSETRNGVLAVEVPSAQEECAPQAYRGVERPAVPRVLADAPVNRRRGTRTPFWLWRHQDGNYWGDETLWRIWDRRPVPYDFCD